MVHQFFNLWSACWKHLFCKQPRETLSVINATQSFRVIYILTIAYLSQFTMFSRTFPEALIQPNFTSSKPLQQWSIRSTKDEVQNWGMSQERTERRGTLLQECFSRRATSCRSSLRFKSCGTKRFVRQLVQSTVNCGTCFRFCAVSGQSCDEHARNQGHRKMVRTSRVLQGIHIFLGNKIERDNAENRWMDSSRQKRIWTNFTPETYPHRYIFHVNDERNSDFFTGTERR